MTSVTTDATDTLKVLFEDESIYVIHKPYGVPFHSTDDEQGIVQAAKLFFNNTEIYPVHRLDKMTSGLMIFAKNKQANSELSQQFANKTIEKYYLAISLNKPAKKQGMVVGDMTKSRNGSYILQRKKENPAITRFFVNNITLKKNQQACGLKAWLFVLKPETGKTHQLRVATKSLGSAIYGDARYGKDKASRGYLHAYKIRFKLRGQLFEVLDPFMNGEEFDLEEIRNNETLAPFLQPEKIRWSKAAFQIK